MSLVVAVLAATASALMLAAPRDVRLRTFTSSIGRRHRWRRRRTDPRLARQAIPAADLLSVIVASGAPLVVAVRAIAESLPEPAGPVLARVTRSLAMGATVREACAPLVGEPSWRPLIDALERSVRTGAPTAQVLARAADDLRRERLRTADIAARAAGVRAVAPLAACFLPGFLLLGVVPVVASLAGAALAGN